jgi:hypothetical protein
LNIKQKKNSLTKERNNKKVDNKWMFRKKWAEKEDKTRRVGKIGK